MSPRLELSLTVGGVILLAALVGLVLVLPNLDKPPPDPTPTLPPPVVTLDACITRCLEVCETETIAHRDCADACLDEYLEAESD